MLSEIMTLVVDIVRHYPIIGKPSGAAIPRALYVVDMFHNGMRPEPANCLTGDLHIGPRHGHANKLIPPVEEVISNCCEPITIRHDQVCRKFQRGRLWKNSLS